MWVTVTSHGCDTVTQPPNGISGRFSEVAAKSYHMEQLFPWGQGCGTRTPHSIRT